MVCDVFTAFGKQENLGRGRLGEEAMENVCGYSEEKGAILENVFHFNNSLLLHYLSW